jgi:hypothetical protein
MGYAERLALADAAVPQWEYGVTVEPEGSRWLRTDPAEGLVRFAIAWYQDGPPPVTDYTRLQYEAACAAAGIDAAPDADLGNYADINASPHPGEWPDDLLLALTLRRRRIAGIKREAPPAPPRPIRLEVERPSRCCDFCGLPFGSKGTCEECV